MELQNLRQMERIFLGLAIEKDGYENDSLNFKSNLKISDSSELSLIGSYSSGNNEYDADIDFDGLVDDQDKYAKFKNHHFGFKYNYLDSDGNLSHQGFNFRIK